MHIKHESRRPWRLSFPLRFPRISSRDISLRNCRPLLDSHNTRSRLEGLWCRKSLSFVRLCLRHPYSMARHFLHPFFPIVGHGTFSEGQKVGGSCCNSPWTLAKCASGQLEPLAFLQRRCPVRDFSYCALTGRVWSPCGGARFDLCEIVLG